MKVVYSIILLAFLATLGIAQIDDETAKSRALLYAERVGSSVEGLNIVVYRHTDLPAISVTLDGMVNIIMGTDGTFASYDDSRRRISNSRQQDKLFDDESAWVAAESILARFDTPSGIARARLVREASKAYSPAVVYCYFNVRPHGYESSAGNTANVCLDQNDGTPVRVSISSGWAYEPPNIRVTHEQAVSKAREIYGGSIEEWHSKLVYLVGSNHSMPSYMREMAANKIQRLCYSLWRETQSRVYSVQIDSVTGQVLTYGETGSTSMYDTARSRNQVEPHGGGGPDAGSGSASHTPSQDRAGDVLYLAYASIAAFIAGTAFWFFRRRSS